MLGQQEEIVEVFSGHVSADGEQGVDLRGDAAILPDRPDGAVVESQQLRDAFLDPLIALIPPEGNDFPVGSGVHVPCPDQRHRDQPARNFRIPGPFGGPDGGDGRKPPPQDGRGAARFPRQPVGFVAFDAHLGKGRLEGLVIQQVEGDVGFRIDGVAGADGDAMPSAIDRGQLAFDRVGVDDRNERCLRCRQLSQRLRRVEHRREVPPARVEAVFLEQA